MFRVAETEWTHFEGGLPLQGADDLYGMEKKRKTEVDEAIPPFSYSVLKTLRDDICCNVLCRLRNEWSKLDMFCGQKRLFL